MRGSAAGGPSATRRRLCKGRLWAGGNQCSSNQTRSLCNHLFIRARQQHLPSSLSPGVPKRLRLGTAGSASTPHCPLLTSRWQCCYLVVQREAGGSCFDSVSAARSRCVSDPWVGDLPQHRPSPRIGPEDRWTERTDRLDHDEKRKCSYLYHKK